MSSLTTIGINKNKKGFAPKIGKRNVRKSNTAATAPSATKEKITEKKTLEHIKQEVISELNTPVLETSSVPKHNGSVHVKTIAEEQNYTINESNRQKAHATTDTNEESSNTELNEFGLTQEEMQMNTLANTARRRTEGNVSPSPSPISAPSPQAPMDDHPDCAFDDAHRSIIKSERVTPAIFSMRKSMSRTLKEDEGERIDAKEILAAAPISSTPASPMNFNFGDASPSRSPTPPPRKSRVKKNKGKGKTVEATISTPRLSGTKRAARATKVKSGASANGSSIGIGIPSVSSRATAISIGAPSTTASDNEDSGSSNKKSGIKRKGIKKFAFRLPENLKTLDDVTNDPARAENLEKPMSSFTKDIDGIVSKNFKELELVRFAAKRKIDDAANLSPEDLAVAKKKEEDESELIAKKRKIAKEKEAERRKKELDGTILAESANALQVRLINGQIVLDTDSLTVERTETDIDYGDGALEVVEENSMTRKINSQTYSKRQRSVRWDALETEQFYDCISQFGTDFEMISMVMPGRTRAQIRTKFNREEKLAPEKITDHLIKKRKPLDLSKYEELAGISLETVPEDFHEMQLA